MRAARVSELGRSPEPVDLETDGPVEVLSVALNPIDLAVGSGRFPGGHPPLPYTPGCEAVARVGGQRMYLFGQGFGVARDGFLAERVDFPEAAAVSRARRHRRCRRSGVRNRRHRGLGASRLASARRARRPRARPRRDGNRRLGRRAGGASSRCRARRGRGSRRGQARAHPRARRRRDRPARRRRRTHGAIPRGLRRRRADTRRRSSVGRRPSGRRSTQPRLGRESSSSASRPARRRRSHPVRCGSRASRSSGTRTSFSRPRSFVRRTTK